jgi:hypothetical protein
VGNAVQLRHSALPRYRQEVHFFAGKNEEEVSRARYGAEILTLFLWQVSMVLIDPKGRFCIFPRPFREGHHIDL